MIFFKGSFPPDVFQEITGITDTLKKNADDRNEQTLQIVISI